ncbi:unnamed protein product [Ectocarpus sp. 13 AM-2016]
MRSPRNRRQRYCADKFFRSGIMQIQNRSHCSPGGVGSLALGAGIGTRQGEVRSAVERKGRERRDKKKALGRKRLPGWAMDSLPSKMQEADQHLDRLGSILRSLRARPSDRVVSSSAAQLNDKARRREHKHVHQPEPLHQHHTHRREKQPQRQQQPQPEQQHHQHEHERFLYVSGSSQSSRSRPSRSRTASQSSQPEVTITTTTPSLNPHQCSGTALTDDRLADKPESDARKRDAPLRRPRRAEMGAVRRSVASPTPNIHERVGGADDKDPRLGDRGPHLGDAYSGFVPWAPSSTVVVRPGVAGAEAGSRSDGGGAGTAAAAAAGAETTKSVRGPSLRERAIRTWWRGLSCGICFAAGAWAREGHGTFGALLALAAVCGEMAFHERAPS